MGVLTFELYTLVLPNISTALTGDLVVNIFALFATLLSFLLPAILSIYLWRQILILLLGYITITETEIIFKKLKNYHLPWNTIESIECVYYQKNPDVSDSPKFVYQLLVKTASHDSTKAKPFTLDVLQLINLNNKKKLAKALIYYSKLYPKITFKWTFRSISKDVDTGIPSWISFFSLQHLD